MSPLFFSHWWRWWDLHFLVRNCQGEQRNQKREKKTEKKTRKVSLAVSQEINNNSFLCVVFFDFLLSGDHCWLGSILRTLTGLHQVYLYENWENWQKFCVDKKIYLPKIFSHQSHSVKIRGRKLRWFYAVSHKKNTFNFPSKSDKKFILKIIFSCNFFFPFLHTTFSFLLIFFFCSARDRWTIIFY